MAIFQGRSLGEPIGPMSEGGFLSIQVNEKNEQGNIENYTLLFLPDKHNDLLRLSGKPMQFYYALDNPKLAKYPNGHYMFHCQIYSGVLDPSKNIGVDGYAEMAGGTLTFTTTLKIPESVMKKALVELKEIVNSQYKAKKRWYWHERLPEPNLSPMPIMDNRTYLHTVSPEVPDGDGTVSESARFVVHGEGKGTLNPTGTNAFTVSLGANTVQMIEAGAKAGTSPLTVENIVKYKLWSPVQEIEITADSKAVFKHLSTHLKGKAFFAKVDISTEINKMAKSGVIDVKVKYDEEFVNEEDKDELLAAKEEVLQAFMAMMKSAIFDVKQPEVTSADAGDLGKKRWGLSFSLKKREDIVEFSATHKETIEKRIIKESEHSATLVGLFEELSKNPQAVEQYFSQVYFEEGFTKLHIVASSNANWGDGNGNPGDPIHALQLQVGYPDSQGQINWKSTARYKNSLEDNDISERGTPVIWTKNTRDRIFVFDFTKHDEIGAGEKIYLRKSVSYKEAPNVKVDEIILPVIETENHVLEVRADSASNLSIGPISLDQELNSTKTRVNLIIEVDGEKKRYVFNHANYAQPQFLDIWYANPKDIPKWKYKVEAVVSGKNPFIDKTMKWESDWTEGQGNGPLMVEVPPVPDDKFDTVLKYLN